MIPQTGIAVIDWFLALLDAWGYLIVFGFTIFENLFVVGTITPGETVVIAASTVAANGLLHLSGVWVASFVGTMVGSNVTYLLGRRTGIEYVSQVTYGFAETRIGRFLRVDPSAVDEVHEHFHTQGAKTVLLSRFAIGAKNIVPAVAGATHMPVFWFELYTALGAIVYTSVMCTIGWFLGENLDLAIKVASGFGWFGLGLLAVFLGGLWYGRKRFRQRKADSEGAE